MTLDGALDYSTLNRKSESTNSKRFFMGRPWRMILAYSCGEHMSSESITWWYPTTVLRCITTTLSHLLRSYTSKTWSADSKGAKPTFLYKILCLSWQDLATNVSLSDRSPQVELLPANACCRRASTSTNFVSVGGHSQSNNHKGLK